MKKYIWFIIAIVILVLALIAFVGLYFSKSSDYAILTNNYDFLSVQYNSLILDYNALLTTYLELSVQYTELQSKYYELVEEYKTLNLEYNKSLDISADLTTELYSAKEELTNYKYEIQTSLDWFKENANLESKSLRSKLDSKCFSSTFSSCKIKAACLDLINEQFMGLKYKDDTTLGKTDKFISISEFLQNKGGDCEDFSLLYKAEINYLLTGCAAKDLTIETFVSGSGNYFIDNSNLWYYADAKKYTLKSGYIYPNIVCGVLKDPNRANTFGGHCVVAFSKEKISSIDDLEKIDLAEMVEPQTGQYIGQIVYGLSTFKTEYYFDGGYVPEDVSYIKQVITDDDYYIYLSGWKSYKYMYDKFIALENDINFILSGAK